jgi:basic amino acid/polyamine antiporter, APA family
MFAELSSKIQRTGSTYIYAYIISGEFMAWYIGWNMFMQYGIVASVMA